MTSDSGFNNRDTDYARHIQEVLDELRQMQQPPQLVTSPAELEALERAIRQRTDRLVLQRGFTPAGWLVRCGACDVKDTPHDFSVGGSSECQAPTACQTRGGAGQSPTPSPPGVMSPLGLFFNRRLMRTTKKCARMINVI
jgi:hypothetical protein